MSRADVVALREKFKDTPRYLRFINDMLRAEREVRPYSARGMEGKEVPSVSCELFELQKIARETDVPFHHDTLGKGYIVYVR